MKERYILTGNVQFGKQYKITDSETDYKYENNKSDKQKICDLLNKVIDENEQLKQSNQKLNDELQETMGYLALKSGVEKENEQLKQTIENICKDYEEAHGMDIRNAEWFKEW